MFDYVRFLTEMTGDKTWHKTPNGRLLNASQYESHVVLEDDSVTLLINGKPIYCGPLKVEQAE